MQIRKSSKLLLTVSLMTIIVAASNAFAAGTAIPFTSVSDMGDAFAGGAAFAQDASTNFTNPAGLVLLPDQQIVASGTGVFLNTTYNGSATAPGIMGLAPITMNGSASANPATVIPALHYALPLSNKLFFGMSVAAPYGLGYDYDPHSMVRYDVQDADAKFIDIGPSLTYKITDKLSAGAGPDAMYASVYQKYMVRTQPLSTSDSESIADVSGWGYGWHAGLLYQFTPKTRVGLSYRSQIVERLTGDSQFEVYDGAYTGTTTSNQIESRTVIPPVTTLSLYENVTEKWAVMATAAFTEWSYRKTLQINDAATLGGQTISVVIPEYYHNSWRYAVGTSYQLTQKWLIRTGVSYDQGATNAEYRDLTIPDSNRTDVSIGGHYQASRAVGIDMGYMHSFFKPNPVTYTDTNTGNTLTGNYKSYADSIGVQVAWTLV